MTVVVRQMATQFVQIEAAVDATQEVIGRDVIFDVEGVEQPLRLPVVWR